MKAVPHRERKLDLMLLGLLAGASLSLFTAPAWAEPYEDTQHRFRLELVSGWAPTPAFGDTDGMVFTRSPVRRGGRSATLRVRIGAALDPDDALARHERELSGPGGLRPGATSRAPLAAGPTTSRAYVRGEGALTDRVEVHALSAVGRLYLLEVTTPDRDHQRLTAEVKKLLDGFRPISAASQGTSGSERTVEVDGAGAAALAGRWRNDDGLVLALGADLSFALDSATGRYEVTGETLTLIIPGQGRESFTFQHDAAAGTLTLSSPNLDGPMTYRRLGAGQGGKASTTRADSEGRLTGTWSTGGKKGTVTLQLSADRSFSLGPHQGQWSASGDTLKLDRGGGDLITYRFKLKQGTLVLSGGDLDDPVRFERTSP